MDILMIGNFGRGWDGSICDEEHIAASLEDWGNRVTRMQREDSNGQLITVGELTPYDFVLMAQWDGYREELVATLKAMYECPIVYWAFDYQADGQEWHERLVRECDVYLSKPFSDSKKHSNWRWLSQDFGPNFLRESESVLVDDKDIDVLFTGSYLPWATERNELIKAVDEKFNLVVHSVTQNEWTAQGIKNSQGPVMDHGLIDLYSRAKIVLSIDHVHTPGYWSDRNFQAMLCGAFVLFRHVPMSEATFGSGVAYFYNQKDMLEQIDFYLRYRGERRLVSDRGNKVASSRGRANDRVKELITIVGEFL